MNYKLIATDMDDTLLNKEHIITKENKDSIIMVQEKGVKFVLASGRPTFAMIDFAEELKMNKFGGYLLGFNGGEIIDLKEKKKINIVDNARLKTLDYCSRAKDYYNHTGIDEIQYNNYSQQLRKNLMDTFVLIDGKESTIQTFKEFNKRLKIA